MKKNYSPRAIPAQTLKKGIKNASLLFLLFIVSAAHTNAQIGSCYVNIPDVNFKNYLINNTDINTNNDMEISCSEAAAFTGTMHVSFNNIADLTGIEAFVNITYLSCSNNALTSLDVSANTALTSLDCYDNALTSLDFSANTALTSLWCSSNALTSLDVSANTALTRLYCWNNNLTSLDVSANTALTFLDCRNNNLTSLNVSANTALTSLYCRNNNLTSLDVSANLINLNCTHNALTSLDVSANTALTSLYCDDNALTSLDVSANTALTSLYCNNNALTSLNVANGNNTGISSFDAQNNPDLSCIQVDDVTYSNTNWANDIDTTASFSNDCSPIVYIPDVNFKNALLSNTAINPNNDTEISYN
ncbi:leucine-rich repeat domain-containing protein, partial [Flavivirga aquimarina]